MNSLQLVAIISLEPALPCVQARRPVEQSHIELPEKTSDCVKAGGGHLEHMLKMNYLSDFGICNNSQCFLTMKITSFC